MCEKDSEAVTCPSGAPSFEAQHSFVKITHQNPNHMVCALNKLNLNADMGCAAQLEDEHVCKTENQNFKESPF